MSLKMNRILLVEDDPGFQEMILELLSEQGEVRVASTLKEAREIVSRERFELILLDMGLPDGTGLEFFEWLQARLLDAADAIPVVFLTGRGETGIQVDAFRLGADDFILKPFGPTEFRARVAAKLKRVQRSRRSAAASSLIECGELRFDLATLKASVVSAGGGLVARTLDLTGTEFKILCYLALRPGEVISREQLVTEIWGKTVHVLGRTVDTHVYTLRKKLGEHSHYVESKVGAGYRLNPQAQRPRAGRKGRVA